MLEFSTVFKYNPYHDPHSGRFAHKGAGGHSGETVHATMTFHGGKEGVYHAREGGSKGPLLGTVSRATDSAGKTSWTMEHPNTGTVETGFKTMREASQALAMTHADKLNSEGETFEGHRLEPNSAKKGYGARVGSAVVGVTLPMYEEHGWTPSSSLKAKVSEVVPVNKKLMEAASDGSYRLAMHDPSEKMERVPFDWAENSEARFDEVAFDMGISNDELKAGLQKHLDEFMSKAKVYTNVSPATMAKILKDGRMKNQYETNSTGGYLSPGLRQRTEQAFFGVEGRHHLQNFVDEKGREPAVKERTVNGRKMRVEEGFVPESEFGKYPIYGYVSDKEGIVRGAVQYGSVRIQLKDSVKERSTFTGTDSLSLSHDIEQQVTTENRGKVGEYFKPLARIVASPVNRPSIRSLWLGTVINAKEKSIKELATTTHDYFESQVWGGVKVSDIGKVFFREPPNKTLESLLKKNHIEYEVEERHG